MGTSAFVRKIYTNVKIDQTPETPGASDQFLFHEGGTCTEKKNKRKKRFGLNTGYLWVSFMDGLK